MSIINYTKPGKRDNAGHMPTTINKTGIAAGKKLSILCLCHLLFSDFKFYLNKIYNEHQNVHLFHFLKPIKQISAYTDDSLKNMRTVKMKITETPLFFFSMFLD